MNGEKMPAHPVEPGGRFWRWLDNFWYHYKWHTIIGAFLIIVLTVGIVQVATQETADVKIMYAGPVLLGMSGTESIMSAVKSVMSDYNGDGKRGVDMVALMIMSSEQIRDAYSKAEENGQDISINTYIIGQEQQKFDNEIMAGEATICFLDPYLYRRVLDSSGFMPLSEIFGTVPACAIDEYGIRLRDTAFGQYFSGVCNLPDDTVLCIRRISSFSFLKGKEKTEVYHSYHVQLMRAIVNFERPEE